MKEANWVPLSEEYVKNLFADQLPDDMFFHNLIHTGLVVKAACEIGAVCEVEKQEMIILQIAAWFHDTGYCYIYDGHEDKSISNAVTFLKQLKADEKFINSVTGCIDATRMPQKPESLIQQILCDADMYHLSVDNYLSYSENLRKEWKAKMGKSYSNIEWRELNVTMLVNHKYFTDYGQRVLQQNKLKNIDRMLSE